jgi:hypothetical protein
MQVKHIDNKKIGVKVLEELRNVVLEENEEEKMARESS